MESTAILHALSAYLDKSHSPYSHVQVAAAVTFDVNGESKVAYGVNIENVSYGLTQCAERSAIAAARLEGMKTITGLYVMSNQAAPISPCGACRQVVTEFMGEKSAPVICVNHNQDASWKSSLSELLPNRFDL